MRKQLESLLHTPIVSAIRKLQFILALGTYAFAALMPSQYATEISTSDHLLHFIGNVLLIASAAVAFLTKRHLITLLLVLAPFSIIVELAQSLAPSRQVDPADMLVNLTGLVIGFLVALLISTLWQSRLIPPPQKG